MPSALPPELTNRWTITELPGGAAKLQIPQQGRGRLVIGALSITLVWWGYVFYGAGAHQPGPFGVSVTAGSIVGLLLAAFAAWCAFASEWWLVGSNRLEHSITVGGWRRVKRYENGKLEIQELNRRWGGLTYRVLVITGGRSRRVLDRLPPEAIAWAQFVADRTGWQLSLRDRPF